MAPFDQQQFEVEQAPALKPSHPSRPASPVVEVLRKGRERIASGWCNTGPGDGRTKFCIVFSVTDPNLSAVHRADTLLKAELPPGFTCMVKFNENPTTTHADVLALFDRAIAAAEGR